MRETGKAVRQASRPRRAASTWSGFSRPPCLAGTSPSPPRLGGPGDCLERVRWAPRPRVAGRGRPSTSVSRKPGPSEPSRTQPRPAPLRPRLPGPRGAGWFIAATEAPSPRRPLGGSAGLLPPSRSPPSSRQPPPPGQGPGDRGAAPLPPEAPCASLRRALAASGCLRGRPHLLWTFSCSFS